MLPSQMLIKVWGYDADDADDNVANAKMLTATMLRILVHVLVRPQIGDDTENNPAYANAKDATLTYIALRSATW